MQNRDKKECDFECFFGCFLIEFCLIFELLLESFFLGLVSSSFCMF